MERDIIRKLEHWKDRKDRKPLIITGVRQCGKTWAIRQFGERAFEDVAYFNFEEDSSLSAVFDHDFKVNRMLDELGNIIRGEPIIPGKTLLILDEIQACPRAITSLKYFCENCPQLHVIAAGSLLGVAIRGEGVSFPVGKVNRIEMFPMSFREFVCADGGKKYLDGLEKMKPDQEISELYTLPLIRYLKLYYIVGGMPEVVRIWTETHNFSLVTEKQDEILKDYADDFGKHAPASELPKIRMIWDSVPVQLAKENNKFVFSHVRQGSRAKELEDALEWLVNAGLIYRLHLVSNPEIPLSGSADATYFKVYMADVGLLSRRSGLNVQTVLNGEDRFLRLKGALAENYVLTQLKEMGINAYFWRTDANAEVDFLADPEGVLLPVEVKSADNTKAKSLHLFCSRYKPKLAVKTSLRNAGTYSDGETQIWSVPLYCLSRLKTLAL